MTHRRLGRVPGGDLEDREGRSVGSDRRGVEWVVKIASGGLVEGGRDWDDGLGAARGWMSIFGERVLCAEGTY